MGVLTSDTPATAPAPNWYMKGRGLSCAIIPDYSKCLDHNVQCFWKPETKDCRMVVSVSSSIFYSYEAEIV